MFRVSVELQKQELKILENKKSTSVSVFSQTSMNVAINTCNSIETGRLYFIVLLENSMAKNEKKTTCLL